MIESLVELFVVSIVLGAGFSFGRNQSAIVSFFLILIFSFCVYVGFLLSYHHWIYIEKGHWIIDTLRVILAASLLIAGFSHYLPFHGFFHNRSRYVWLVVSFLGVFVGWHAGMVYGWFPAVVLYIGGFIFCLLPGRALGTTLYLKWKRYPLSVHFPFLFLLLFSIILLL